MNRGQPFAANMPSLPVASLAVHRRDICRYVAALGVPERMVEELAQDTLMAALRRYEEFRGESSVKTWLRGIAFHLVLNWRRRRGHHERCDAMDFDCEDSPRPWGDSSQTNAFDDYLLKELCLQVDNVLGSQPEAARRLWRMVVLEETAVSSASHLLDLNHSQATVMLAKTNRRIRRALRASQAVHTPK